MRRRMRRVPFLVLGAVAAVYCILQVVANASFRHERRNIEFVQEKITSFEQNLVKRELRPIRTGHELTFVANSANELPVQFVHSNLG